MPTTVPTRSRKRSFFRWSRFLLTGFLGLLIALVCAGAIYEAIESHRDRLSFHPPGQLVDIGGYRLHLYCTGQGSPAAVVDAICKVVSQAKGAEKPAGNASEAKSISMPER